MSTFEREAEISATADEVWAVLADFGAISGWAPNCDHSCLMSDQTDGVGTVRRVQAGRFTLVEQVVEWDPPATLSYGLEGLPPVVRSATNTWRIEASGAGSRVSLTTEVDAGPRPPQKLIARVAARKLAQASDQMLAGLKEELS